MIQHKNTLLFTLPADKNRIAAYQNRALGVFRLFSAEMHDLNQLFTKSSNTFRQAEDVSCI